MSRMTEAEKTLLAFMASGTMGTVRIHSETPDAKTIYFLYTRGLVELQSIYGYFTYDETYWSLTEVGWKKGTALLKKAKK